ncbi:MAG: YdcF family protein [Gammaproteobacteria bacterium]
MWFRHLTETLILPPAGPLLLAILGLLLTLRWRRTGMTLAAAGIVLAWLASLPVVVYPLAGLWSSSTPPLTSIPTDAQAIVVLGAGRRDAPEYGGQTLTPNGLQRVRYAAWLARRTGLPVLTSGGSVTPESQLSEAVLMREVLERDFHVPVRWVEQLSHTTWQNAQLTAYMLKPLGIRRVLLVTQAWHMPRALWSFRKAGLDPIAAPTGFAGPDSREQGLLGWLPQARAARTMTELAHEVLGLTWYRLHY